MRTVLKSLLIAVVSISLLEAPVLAAPSRPLGVILQADRARVSSGDAANGATVYDGDTLSTDNSGGLRVRVGESQFYLLGNSAATVHQAANGASAVLGRGTAVFNSAAVGDFELVASEAHIRATQKATVGQVTLVGPYELLLTCQRGQLQVIIGDEIHTVAENASYRVFIDPAPQGPQGSGRPPLATAKSRWLLVALLLIAAGTAVGIWRATISPSGP